MSLSEPSPLARNPLTLQPPPPLQSHQSHQSQQPQQVQSQPSLSFNQNQQHNPHSLRAWIGNIATLVAYNRIPGRHLGKITLAWIVFTLSFSHLMWRATFAKVTPLVQASNITPLLFLLNGMPLSSW